MGFKIDYYVSTRLNLATDTLSYFYSVKKIFRHTTFYPSVAFWFPRSANIFIARLYEICDA